MPSPAVIRNVTEPFESLGKRKRKIPYLPLVLVLLLAVFVVPQLSVQWNKQSVETGVVLKHRLGNPALMKCPGVTLQDGNSETDHYDYHGVSKEIMSNVTGYLANFREQTYDQWGKTYNKVKSLMLPWKERVYSHAQSGWSIYESACGIGLNLYMTLEILESMNVTDITVFGNEYVEASVQVARHIGEQLPGRGKVGNICPGDSSNISYVPSNAFDIVFTGYVTPLQDPLGLFLADEDAYPFYGAICADKDEKNITLARKQQRHQEDWYAAWASELIRIAKPGAWIIIEQISRPICEESHDWGGVDESFWYRAVQFHAQFLNVDQASFDFEDDRVFRNRYHVRFRKLLSPVMQ